MPVLQLPPGDEHQGVVADDGIPEGAVFIPFCYAEAAANLLTNPALDPFAKIPEFKYCAVRVTRGGELAAARSAC